MIYHIATAIDWNLQLTQTTYAPAGFAKEGFIHCSKKDQVPGVLQRYYAGVKDLILLHIDEAKLSAELKYEAATNEELYPHVFGEINKEAIVKTERLT
jgi:uncharacterized protein (DUF952 family)